jgi:hypothetical protein
MRAFTVFFGGLVAIVFLVVLGLRKGVQRLNCCLTSSGRGDWRQSKKKPMSNSRKQPCSCGNLMRLGDEMKGVGQGVSQLTDPFGPPPFGFVILGMALLVIITIGSDNLYWVVSDFYNAEFYALRHLPFSR